MIGKTYGYLTVNEMLPNYRENGKMYCQCRCVCGNGTIKEAFTLRRSKTASCGCKTDHHRSVWQRKDETGKTFGYLTILNIDYDRKPAIAHCRCKCGRLVSIPRSDVARGHTRSCGCYQAEVASRINTKDFSGYRSASGVEICEKSYQTERGVWMWRCRCPLCGGIFDALPAKVIRNHTTSCGCKVMSSRERMIKSVLDSLNVQYCEQKRFPDCKSTYTLPFDFAVYYPDGNINCLIEYDGQQHFKPVPMYGGIEALRVTQKRDAIKTEYCKSKNITLLRLNDSDDENDIRTKITNTIYP